MQPDDFPKSGWQPLPPVRHTEISRRIGWLNLPFAVFYLFFFLRSLGRELADALSEQGIPIYFEITAYFISFVSLLIGGILLLRENRFGKKLTQIAGILSILTICVFGAWSLTLFWMPEFEQYPISVLENFFRLVVRYALRFAYPIIVSFILIKKTDEYLGLA